MIFCPQRNIIPTRTIIQGVWVSSSSLLLSSSLEILKMKMNKNNKINIQLNYLLKKTFLKIVFFFALTDLVHIWWEVVLG